MENSERFLFADGGQTPRWYVALSETKWIGPLRAREIYDKVQAAELTWAHYAMKSGEKEWKRLSDCVEFRDLIPGRPKLPVPEFEPPVAEQKKKPTVRQAQQRENRPAQTRGQTRTSVPPPPPKKDDAAVAENSRVWFLHYNESQFGPFSSGEVVHSLRVKKITPNVYVWKEGMGDWEKLQKITEFQDPLEDMQARGELAKPSAKETATFQRRKGPRKPLVAQVLLSNDETVITGVCRDISVGGMQVLTDRIPGKAGEIIRLNVSPPAKGGGLAPFIAEGEIVRILEDQRGFSFRFVRLPESTRKAIERYIASDT